jgi:hypothetical protein
VIDVLGDVMNLGLRPVLCRDLKWAWPVHGAAEEAVSMRGTMRVHRSSRFRQRLREEGDGASESYQH